MKKAFKILFLGLFCTLLLGGAGACKEEEPVITPETCNHTYSEWSTQTAPTCEAEGEEARTCSVCNYTQTRVMPILAHESGEWTMISGATCAQEGLEEQHCIHCDTLLDSRTIPISQTHELFDKESTPATCTQTGVTIKQCLCGENVISITTPNLGGHKDENGDLICDVCEGELTRVKVQLNLQGNATATAPEYFLFNRETGGYVEVTLGENSAMQASHTTYPALPDDPDYVGGNCVTKTLSYIEKDKAGMLTTVYQKRVIFNETFGAPTSITFDIVDTNQTALVIVSQHVRENGKTTESWQVRLYWGKRVDKNDEEAMLDPANATVIPAELLTDESLSLLYYTGQSFGVCLTPDLSLVLTDAITKIDITYERKGS